MKNCTCTTKVSDCVCTEIYLCHKNVGTFRIEVFPCLVRIILPPSIVLHTYKIFRTYTRQPKAEFHTFVRIHDEPNPSRSILTWNPEAKIVHIHLVGFVRITSIEASTLDGKVTKAESLSSECQVSSFVPPSNGTVPSTGTSECTHFVCTEIQRCH